MTELALHRPVMLTEVLEALRVVDGGHYCDATVGYGGHTRVILEQSAPTGRVIGLDRDPNAIRLTGAALSDHGARLTLVHTNFADAEAVLRERGVAGLDGVLADLGVSSVQLDTPGRGFSFSEDGPLDMRMDPTQGERADELLARVTVDELAGILRTYGEEHRARRIARAIKAAVEEGQLGGTHKLARIVSRAVGGQGPRGGGKIHPATRTFMALRIAVNDELAAVERLVSGIWQLLKPRGRLAVIAFHSLEDRIVKRTLASLASPCTCPSTIPVCVCHKQPLLQVITTKPLTPSPREVDENPRARSARLRVAERLP